MVFSFRVMAFTPFLHHLCEQSFKLLYSLSKRIVRHVNVPIHGSLDAGVTQQFLQHFGLHSALDCAGGIGVTECVHTNAFDPCFVAELVQMGIIRAVFAGAPVRQLIKTRSRITSLDVCPVRRSIYFKTSDRIGDSLRPSRFCQTLLRIS